MLDEILWQRVSPQLLAPATMKNNKNILIKNCKNIYLHKLLQFSVLGDSVVPLGSDGHLVTSSLVTEASSKSWSRMTGTKTLCSAVSDLVVAVKTQERVVAARTVMTTWMFARVKTPTSRVVSR